MVRLKYSSSAIFIVLVVTILFSTITSGFGLPPSASQTVVGTTYTFSFAFGSLGSANGQFNRPFAIAADSSGNVYVVDTGNNRVEEFSSSGVYVTQWGSKGAGNGQFSSPGAIAIDSSDYVYVVDSGNNRVEKFSSSGGYVAQWGSFGSGNGQFLAPHGVAIASGYVYVADNGNNRVEEFTSSGVYVTQWGCASPRSSLPACTAGSGNGQFNGPFGIAIDSSDNVYVTDARNNRVEEFTSSGVYVTQWGSMGSGNGQFNFVSGVAIDSSDNVYVVDTGNNRVEEFTSSGVYVTQWGSTGSGNGQFSDPYYVVVESGYAYVTDYGNNRVEVFQPSTTEVTQSEPVITGWSVNPNPPLMGKPYQITVEVQNPDPNNAHTYTLQLQESCEAQHGCVTEQGISFPSWETSELSLVGVPTQWPTNPTCEVSGASEGVPEAFSLGTCVVTQSETVQAGQTATFTFTFTNNWAWIPPFNWQYLEALVVGVGISVAGGPVGVGSATDILSELEPILAGSYAVPEETFNFQLLSGGTSFTPSSSIETTFSSPVQVGIGKQNEYAGSVIASIAAGLQTSIAINGCVLTIVGCVATPWLLATQGLTIVGQIGLYDAATDPDLGYTQIVQPGAVALTNGTLIMNLPVVESLPPNQITLIQAMANELSYQNATTISIERYTAALEAGSQYYANLQLEAIQNYALQRDQAMSHFVNLLSVLPPFPSFNSTSIQFLRNYLQTNGLPAIEQQIFTGLGLSWAIPEVTAGLTLLNATSLNRFTLVGAFQLLQYTLENETAIWTSKQVSPTHPTILLNPSSATPGTTVLVSGSGFSLSDSTCSLSGTTVGSSGCSISGGTLSGSFVVGNAASGSYVITATGSSGDSASTTLSVSIGTSSQTSQASVLKVWFDIPYFLDTPPCSYQLVVHAQTTNGLSIINLHWDWGDGSTLDVPFAGSSQVTDSRTHSYVNAGTYVVSVTATDSAGNTGIGYWGLDDAFPASCEIPVGTAGVTPPTSNGTATASAIGATIPKLKTY